jgi:diacylglycerol kinase family enzyme
MEPFPECSKGLMALNRKPVTVLWNSAAGWSDSDEQVRQVESILAGDGAPVTVFRIKKGEDITATSRRLLGKGAEILVAAGGDGTINGVASALVHSPASLAVIPAGTLNHFARDLGIPLDVAGAAECARNGHPIETDVGCVNNRIFVNNSVLGLYPLYRAAREAYERKGLGGNRITQFFAVVRAIVRVLWHLPHLKLQLQMEDGGVLPVETPFVLIANNEHEVENWNIGHRTSLNKGHLWVYVMRRCSRWAMVRFFASFLFRRFSRREAFDIYRTRAVTVDTKAAHLRVGVDGEIVRMETPLRYSSLPKALRVIAPLNYLPDADA